HPPLLSFPTRRSSDLSNVPTGTYLIDVFLVREGRIVDAQNMPLIISKVGFGADLYKYAHANNIATRLGYGIVAVLVSLFTGWLADRKSTRLNSSHVKI